MKLSGFVRPLLLVFAVGIASATVTIPGAIKTDITNGINAANALSKYINDRNFTATLTKLTGLVSPFLGALGPIVGLVLGFFGSGPSAELQYMQKMMVHIDARFDAVDTQLAVIGRKIDHVHTQAIFGPIENNIHFVFGKLKELLQASHSTAIDAKKTFVSAFNSNGVGNAQKIYDGLMSTNNIFSTNLGDATMQYTENDRGQTQRFLLGLLNLLLNAVKAELSYYKAVGRSDSYIKDQKDKWVHKIASFKNQMAHVDSVVAGKWNEQSNKEVDHYASTEKGRNNQDLANFLYNHLQHKYFWRDWLVLVYDDITGSQIHYMHTCGGWNKYRNNGHNIVISSVDKHAHASSATQRSSDLHHVVTQDRHEHRMRGKLLSVTYTDKKAEDIYNSFPATIRVHCVPYAYLGVITKTANLKHYPASSNRLTVYLNHNYNVVAFG